MVEAKDQAAAGFGLGLDGLDDLLNAQGPGSRVPAEDQDQGRGSERIPKSTKERLNERLLMSIIRRLRRLYLTATEEEKVLIAETLDDLEQLMILNRIGLRLLKLPKDPRG